MRNKRHPLVILSIISSMLMFTGCRNKSEPVNTNQEVENQEIQENQELDLADLLSIINDSVVEHCGSEYTLTPFIQYKLSDGNLTDDLSAVNLEDNQLTVYVLFQIPQQGEKLEDMSAQHYIEAVVDISSMEVLSLSESDGAIDGNYTNIF